MDEIKVAGDELVATVKKVIAEGNIRRITVKNKEGKVVFELPLTLGIVGIALTPFWAALGAAASLLTECTVSVERDPDAPAPTSGTAQ